MAQGSPALEKQALIQKNKTGPRAASLLGKGDKGVATTKQAKPKRRKFKHLGAILLLLIIIVVLLPLLVVHQITTTEQNKIYTSVDTIPARPVAMILGAGVTQDSTPGLMLTDRLEAGVKLYKVGKVQTLLMTGGEVEVTIMRRYAQQHGVPSSAIITDNSGLRTYDSCYRAGHDLNISDAIVVTQEYHLPRTLYLCNSLGVNAVGLKAGGDNYGQDSWNHFREFFAQIEAWTDVNVSQPRPKADKQ